MRSRSLDKRIAKRRVIASVSGGRDSGAMSLHLKELGVPHERVFMDTGWEHPLTYEYIRGPLTAALGPITEIRGPLSFVELARRKAMFPSRVTRFCTVELKVKPVKEYLAELADEGDPILNVVGIRRQESKARSEAEEWEWSDTFDCEVWRPLVHWTGQDVLDIHERHDLETNPLYALGATRVGCWPCIHARKAEIALVADLDPGRIEEIRALEQELNESAQARHPDEELRHARTFFSYGGGGRKHFALPILGAVDWARSKRGEWQPPGASDGCVRHGVCETAAPEPDETHARLQRGADE